MGDRQWPDPRGWEALTQAEAEQDALRGGLAAHPTEEGGPGHEDTYWLKRKLQAAIRHLRDIEDEFRLRGGLPEGLNQKRADRARQLYEAISDDFLNGRMDRPTVRERAESAERERDEAREALRAILHFDEPWAMDAADIVDQFQEFARAALAGEPQT